MIYVVIMAAVFLADYVIKDRIEKKDPKDVERTIVGGRIRLSRFHNTGMCMSIMKGRQKLVMAVSLIFTLLVTIYFIVTLTKGGSVLLKTGLALVILDILALMTGVAAVIGLVLLLSGLFFTFGGDMTALYILSGGVLLAGIVFYFLLDHLSQSRLWQKVTLRDSLTGQKGFKSSAADLSAYAGKEGMTDSVLRPSGKVDIEGHILDAVSRGDFIEKGKKVIVIKAEGSYLVVKKTDTR